MAKITKRLGTAASALVLAVLVNACTDPAPQAGAAQQTQHEVVMAADHSTGGPPQSPATPPAKECTDLVSPPGDRSWIQNDAAQAINSAVQKRIARIFGVDSKADPESTLARGLLGVVQDHGRQEIVVVVDDELTDTGALEAELRGVAKTEQRKHPKASELGLRIDPGCFTVSELLSAAEVISARSWSPGARDASFYFRLHAEDSTYHVNFSAKDAATGDALKAKLGPLVTISYGAGPALD